MIEEILVGLAAIDARVVLNTSHDCARDVWGWSATVGGPRMCSDEPSAEGEQMGLDESHEIEVTTWALEPGEALIRAAESYRAAYAASSASTARLQEAPEAS